MAQNNSKILITGGLGNLGSWLTEDLANKGYNVYVLAHRQREVLINPDYHMIFADISYGKDLFSKLTGYSFDYVIHTAGAHDHFVEGYAWKSLVANAWGTRNLLEFLKDNPCKQLIYFSTFQVYGKRAGTITEETPPVPVNDYGLTHLFAEYYIRQYHNNHGIPFSILRLTNGYGCPKDLNSSKWYLILNDLAQMAVTRRKIELKSNGEASRDFVWLGTVCEIIEKLIGITSSPNDIFNISGEKTYKMIEIAHMVQEAFKEEYKEDIPVHINKNDNKSYSQDLYVKNQKLRNIIDFQLPEKFKDEAKKIFRLLSVNG